VRKPDISSVKDPTALLSILSGFYDAIQDAKRAILPSRVPVLKHATASTHADLRKIVGHIDGESGPRVCIVTGDVAVLDGGEGSYVWDPDSTLIDDNTATIQPVGIARGRWRKASL
jgi:hypothetical protein